MSCLHRAVRTGARAATTSRRTTPRAGRRWLSGGEPFEQAEQAAKLARAAKQRGLHVICYTGYTFEYLRAHADGRNGWNELLAACDILVDGRFEQKQKDLTLRFRGSRNQRVIDLAQSLARGSVVETEF